MYGLEHHSATLFTVLSELYLNALDHGVLQLSSQLKAGQDGFSNYFTERESRLENLSEGHVSITVTIEGPISNRMLRITVEDSGEGFDPAGLDQGGTDQEGNPLHSGRGILLVRGLCDAVHYSTPGNRVTVHCRLTP